MRAGFWNPSGVFGHLLALVPGDGSTQLRGQGDHRLGEGVGDGLGGVAVREPDEHDEAGLAFDQRGDRTIGLAEDQIAFLTVQAVVEARRVLIALLGAAGMASDRPVVSTMSMTAHWEWPPAALLVARPLIETRAKWIVG